MRRTTDSRMVTAIHPRDGGIGVHAVVSTGPRADTEDGASDSTAITHRDNHDTLAEYRPETTAYGVLTSPVRYNVDRPLR
ncbi:hypothetical protein H4F95_24680 [Escherichia coli]|uniref:hypothetical protein n=1 Tax=Escherichia coli TaxID=562 RepID=UPI001BCC4656|nr:hypothetical protein [Escherichia coli]QVL97922.1 hypothetical protein H4F95_24680 [Escherichia coli]